MGATALETRSAQLDAILNEICGTLRLSDEQFALAERKYREVGEWLTAAQGPFSQARGAVYPQGSMRLRTSVRPRRSLDEVFDLDAVFQVDAPAMTPELLYMAVLKRLEQNPDFRSRIERKNRCIRLVYGGAFHLDLLPARTATAEHPRAIEVPDRERRDWHPSNPEGFAQWFEGRCSTAQGVLKARSIQPLHEPIAPALLEPLRRVVQLMKRRRDNWFPEGAEPTRSIVLTTLAAQQYTGADSTSEALTETLHAINRAADRAEAARGRLVVLNPVRPEEDFSERWTGDPKAYRDTRRFLKDFAQEMDDLNRAEGLDTIAQLLNTMFGSELGTRAVKRAMERWKEAKDTGKLGFQGPAIVVGSAAARPIAAHTFHHG